MNSYTNLLAEALSSGQREQPIAFSAPLWWQPVPDATEQRAINWESLGLFFPQALVAQLSEKSFFCSSDLMVLSAAIFDYMKSAVSVSLSKTNAEMFYRATFFVNLVRAFHHCSSDFHQYLCTDDFSAMRVSYRTTGYLGFVECSKDAGELFDLALGEPSRHVRFSEVVGPVIRTLNSRLPARSEPPKIIQKGALRLAHDSSSQKPVAQQAPQRAIDPVKSRAEVLANAPEIPCSRSLDEMREALLSGCGYCVASLGTSGPSPASCEVLNLSAIRFDGQGKEASTFSMAYDSEDGERCVRSFFDFLHGHPVFVDEAEHAKEFLSPLRTRHGEVRRVQFYDARRATQDAWPEAKSHDPALLSSFLGIQSSHVTQGLVDCAIVGRALSLASRRVGLRRAAFQGDTKPH